MEVTTNSGIECIDAYGSEFSIQTMICADSPETELCTNDIGGPLVCNGKLSGIASLSKGCGSPGYPGLYTKIEAFTNWIEQNAK